ncbi:hypothetical protein [Flavobacterium sp. DSR2-3-3]|uniref:hypothetical protein n=1 Tax=Flavobacterium sp. DSR2-3-3 TaxID=2804632 RepID=UPI003CE72BEC
MQVREPLSINSVDISISRSKQLESAVPPSTISYLSSGEFVGMVADDPDCKIKLKTFHCEILNDHDAPKKEEANYKDIAILIKIDTSMVKRNYLQIKQDIQEIMQSEMERLLNDSGLAYLMLKK